MAEGQTQSEETKNTNSPPKDAPESIKEPETTGTVDLPSDDPNELNARTKNNAARLTKHSNDNLSTLEALIKSSE